MTDGPNETIPERLLTLVRLDAQHPVQQPSVEFSPDRWVERAPDHADVFAELPGLLDRASVRGFCDQQSYDDVGGVGVFIASQVWGYGRVGYGPFRLGEALADPRLAAVLSSTRALLRNGRTTDAFRELCVTHELPWVGTAFGTKFMHFADPTGSALILDSVVACWLRQHTGIRLRCLRERTRIRDVVGARYVVGRRGRDDTGADRAAGLQRWSAGGFAMGLRSVR